MPQRLSTRMTVQSSGLFAVLLVAVGIIVYTAVVDHARRNAQTAINAAAETYVRVWQTNGEALSQAAMRTAQDPDPAALDHWGRLTGASLAVITQPNGKDLRTGDGVLVPTAASAEANAGPRHGLIQLDGVTYLVGDAPVASGGRVVFASPIDDAALSALKPLAALPLKARIVMRDGVQGRDAGIVNAFISANLAHKDISVLSSYDGLSFAEARALPGLDGQNAPILLLSYPVNDAISAHMPLLGLLLGLSLLALIVVAGGNFYLLRALTRPLRVLTEAAGELRNGRFRRLNVRTGDEMQDLAQAFNTMAQAIEDRESRIMHMARHDMASRLPNRAALEEHMQAVINRSGAQGLMVFAIGIERFSQLRAVWGSDTADGLFEVIARTLLLDYPSAQLARLNTDTLALVMLHDSDGSALSAAPVIARSLAHRLDARFVVRERSLDIAVSVGFAVTGQASVTASERLDRAVIALDQARAAKLKVLAFSTGIYDALSDNLQLTEDLHTALERNELHVHYQPKYNYRTQQIAGAEALVRWQHSTRGHVSPQRFVLIAEQTGYIRDLTLQVIQTVIDDQARLKAAGHDIEMSINYSGRLLNDEAFIETTLALLSEASGRICLEITETAVIEDPKLGLAAIERFTAAGIDISIDDFGTGLSSLAYLKLIPAQELKIDRSFIKDIESSQKDALVVRSTIDLGHGLGMKITAEGVESDTTLTMLAAMGCDMAQGFGIASPMSYADLEAFLPTFTTLSPSARPAKRSGARHSSALLPPVEAPSQ